MTGSIRVIKLGGSLLSRPTWRADFLKWYESNLGPLSAAAANIDILIVGGGEPVNKLRELAGRIHLDDSTAHWIAIEFMSANARMVADQLDCPLVETLGSAPKSTLPFARSRANLGRVARHERGGQIQAPHHPPRRLGSNPPASGRVEDDACAKNTSLVILAPALLLQSGRIPLEKSWRVTSDSIAAAIAQACNATELVLLKSKRPPLDISKGGLDELVRIGYVDECFPTASAGITRVAFDVLPTPSVD